MEERETASSTFCPVGGGLRTDVGTAPPGTDLRRRRARSIIPEWFRCDVTTTNAKTVEARNSGATIAGVDETDEGKTRSVLLREEDLDNLKSLSDQQLEDITLSDSRRQVADPEPTSLLVLDIFGLTTRRPLLRSRFE
jgi:hypothetical protein